MHHHYQFLTNPFAAYASGFLLALAVYSLGYSDLYPPLQSALVWFILATCVVSLTFARLIGTVVPNGLHEYESTKSHGMIFAAIFGVFMLETAANGGLPLTQTLAGAGMSYREFGVPVVHVAFAGFCYFFAVYWFDLYLLRQGGILFFFSLFALCTSLLTFSRGTFVITFLALVVVYVRRRGLSSKLIMLFSLLFAACLWGFGFLGDIRTHGGNGESIILEIGEASDKFLQSKVPVEFFWPYLYVSSPLANLELNVTDKVVDNSPLLYFITQICPDFVSKRLVSEADIAKAQPLLITEQLTVSTLYGQAFVLMGWIGLCFSFLYFVSICVVCLRVLRGSRYLVATTALLSSLAFLSIFDNMLVASGGIMPVLVALLLSFFERKSSYGVGSDA